MDGRKVQSGCLGESTLRRVFGEETRGEREREREREKERKREREREKE